MNFDNLAKLPIEELRILALKHGVKAHHKAKAETLARQIIEAATKQPEQPEMQHPAQKKVEPPKINTEEEVREVCKQFIEKEGFEAIFTETTWHFKFRGAEDTGHLSVPLRVIRMKAETVSRGARKPVKIRIDGDEIFAA